MDNINKKAVIAMSGGVDSSVAALIMKDKGYECLGVTMKLIPDSHDIIDFEASCCTKKDIEDAQKVAQTLGIPHYLYNFSDRFKECVIDNFVSCYENGRTPNPCVECNRHLKFAALFGKAEELGCELVVTGHYAKVEFDEKSGRYLLKKADDLSKDQSYVLYALTQSQLSKAYFPLGKYSKDEVRKIAEENSFINADKGDSQDICFVKNCTYSEFIENYTGKKYPEGNFVDADGKVLGRHKGIIRYTVGQRKGLGLALPEPLYVSKVDKETNTVFLSKEEDIFTRELYAENINLISCEKIEGKMNIKAKIRYRQQEAPATVEQLGEDRLRIVFDTPQRAVTKGQAVVLYDCDTVVGGGTIC